jgi:hypothetical protein
VRTKFKVIVFGECPCSCALRGTQGVSKICIVHSSLGAWLHLVHVLLQGVPSRWSRTRNATSGLLSCAQQACGLLCG